MWGAQRLLLTLAWLPAQGNWGPWSPLQYCGTDLRGATVGLVGLGAIGATVARLLRGFECNILYSAPREKAVAAEVGAKHVPFDTLLAESDVISVHCPLTDDTRGLFGKPQFDAMKPSAILINTSRGAVVDQVALVHALQNGDIGSAGMWPTCGVD